MWGGTGVGSVRKLRIHGPGPEEKSMRSLGRSLQKNARSGRSWREDGVKRKKEVCCGKRRHPAKASAFPFTSSVKWELFLPLPGVLQEMTYVRTVLRMPLYSN